MSTAAAERPVVPKIASEIFSFIGQNIKGTPKMSADKVRHDVGVVDKQADLFVLQEFKWEDYWESITRVAGKENNTFPSESHGRANPVQGGQPCVWDISKFKLGSKYQALLMDGEAGISDDRWLRGVEVAVRSDRSLRVVFGGTHFVVGGDGPHDSPRRKAILRSNLNRLDQFLYVLKASGAPVIFELDANIGASSWAYPEFRRILKKHKAKLYGNKNGVEYLFVIQGRHTKIVVHDDFIVSTNKLFTDHEGRGIEFHLERLAS
jgi:hypothetical protein